MLRVHWLIWEVSESKLTYLVIFLRQQRAKGSRVWASHLSKRCVPVYAKVGERAAENQLPLKKKVSRAFRCLQLGLSNAPAFSFGLRVFLASNWEWETSSEVPGLGRLKHMGYGKPPPANVYLYFVSSDSSKHWNRNLLPEVLFLNSLQKQQLFFLTFFSTPQAPKHPSSGYVSLQQCQ